jgi:O-antigen/teichoic acid export membrane protein
MRSRFQTGITFNLIGAVFNQGSTLVVNVILANLLGRQTFGKYAMVQSTVLTLALIAQIGTGYTATKYVAEFRSTNRDRAGRVLAMLSIFSVIGAGLTAITLLFVAPWLADTVLKAPELGPTLAIGAGVLLFAALNGLLVGALAGLEGYRSLAIALAWSGVAYLFICTGLAVRGGLNGAVAGLALSGLAQFILLAVALRRECSLQGIKLRYAGIAQEWAIIFNFALPGALTGFTSAPALWLASIFLVRQPNGYSQVATYSASFSLMTAVLFLPTTANNVGMSIINYHKGAGDKRDYQRSFWINLTVTSSLMILGVAVASGLGPELLRLFGKNFKDGYPTLLILLLAAVPQGLAVALYQMIQSQAKMWLSFIAVALPRDTLIVVLAHFLITSYGARGVAFAYAISWTVALVVIAGIVFRIGLQPTGGLVSAPSANAGAGDNNSHTNPVSHRCGCHRLVSHYGGL